MKTHNSLYHPTELLEAIDEEHTKKNIEFYFMVVLQIMDIKSEIRQLANV